ncbi:sulfur carrier protein ThiS [Xenorhabdus sp. Reich]|uniref:Sulfur carrier protein ThiS n=2 Tax=Xenorhabdus littoralis TaxID=2582835 RepID=A0ABU4SKU7_9GAMM|nr:sulfur carrier protein ThiS [Xenorhabdus sp. Reich]
MVSIVMDFYCLLQWRKWLQKLFLKDLIFRSQLMNILVNGLEFSVSGSRLGQILTELGYDNMVLVTAVNGNFVSTEKRDEFKIKNSDKIEVLAPMQGG